MTERYPIISGAEAFYFSGGEIGILLTHGFLGTPQSVRYLGEEFAKLGYTVMAPRLKGHGTHDQDLEECTHEDWFSSLDQGYQQLAQTCRRVIVIGQSMGGALTLWLAQRYPEIEGIILINAALEVPAYESLRGRNEPKWLPESAPDIKREDVVEITYQSVSLHAIHELQAVMDATPAKLGEITTPILGIHSAIDHVVPPENTDYILQTIASTVKEKLVLANSYHVASMDHDREVIVKHCHQFIQAHVVQNV